MRAVPVPTEDDRLRVKRGAAWLDERAPGWEHAIDLTQLRMRNCHDCVIGQVATAGLFATDERSAAGVRFNAVIREAAAAVGDDPGLWDIEHGFNTEERPTTDPWGRLGEAWSDLIRGRRLDG